MNSTSTIAALREIADAIETYPSTSPGSALRLRDIATTLERQGGALDTVALAERLEAAAAAINAAAERLDALTVATPDLDVAHVEALRGLHNAPPPIVTSRAVTKRYTGWPHEIYADVTASGGQGGAAPRCPDGKPCESYAACVNAGGCTRE